MYLQVKFFHTAQTEPATVQKPNSQVFSLQNYDKYSE